MVQLALKPIDFHISSDNLIKIKGLIGFDVNTTMVRRDGSRVVGRTEKIAQRVPVRLGQSLVLNVPVF